MKIRKSYTPEFKAQIVLEILKEEKTIAQIASEHGIHPNMLNRWKKQALENLPQLFSDEKKAVETMKAEYENKIQDLYQKIGRLTTQLTWLKKNLASQLTRDERIALIDFENRKIPLKAQAELLSLNRSSLYYKHQEPSAEELAIKHRIDEIYGVSLFMAQGESQLF
jgi:putative transposase